MEKDITIQKMISTIKLCLYLLAVMPIGFYITQPRIPLWQFIPGFVFMCLCGYKIYKHTMNILNN